MNRRPDYDETFCGKLPLHNINLIQPHGYLVVFTREDHRIIQVSENCEELMGIAPEQITGSNIQQWISIAAGDMAARFASGTTNRLPFYLDIATPNGPCHCLALVHARESCLLMELFREEEKNHDFVSVYQTLRHCFAEIEMTSNLQDMSTAVVRQLKRISGFDRILVYQFDKDWNGKVIAESKAEDMDSYLGQQFPASDIPKQARAMYQKNTYRIIPDRSYTPVKLYPVINPLTNAFTDLSDCSIRSVAAVHIEYLRNMGIMASVSFRILLDEQLWGLISLHHRQPYYLDYETCSLLELLSGSISNHMRSIVNREQFRMRSDLLEIKSALQEYIYQTGNLSVALFEKQDTVLKLFQATGAALLLDGRITTAGTVPPGEFMENAGFWLQSKNYGPVFASDNFSAVFEEAAEYDKIASGILVLTLDKEKVAFLILFRPEVEATINWGGNPGEAVQFEQDKRTYHPRKSFENFRELVKQTSAGWQEAEIRIAGELRNFLFEFLVKHA